MKYLWNGLDLENFDAIRIILEKYELLDYYNKNLRRKR